LAKKKNSANYRISGAPSTSSSILPLALSSDEHMPISTLETWLWDAACAIRGATDAPKFKDFILPLIFYKRLSDVFDDECQQYVDHFGEEELARQFIQEDHRRALAEGHAPIVRFYIPDEYHWIHLRNHPADSHLGEFLKTPPSKERGVLSSPSTLPTCPA
jgi:type I restriction enzyme M protein